MHRRETSLVLSTLYNHLKHSGLTLPKTSKNFQCQCSNSENYKLFMLPTVISVIASIKHLLLQRNIWLLLKRCFISLED